MTRARGGNWEMCLHALPRTPAAAWPGRALQHRSRQVLGLFQASVCPRDCCPNGRTSGLPAMGADYKRQAVVCLRFSPNRRLSSLQPGAAGERGTAPHINS